MKNPKLIAKKLARAKAIASRCREADVEPPAWVLQTLQRTDVLLTDIERILLQEIGNNEQGESPASWAG